MISFQQNSNKDRENSKKVKKTNKAAYLGQFGNRFFITYSLEVRTT